MSAIPREIAGARITAEPRSDWTKAEVEELFERPFNDLLYTAQQVHRLCFDPNAVQVSTLLSIKTGACPEDCAYCPQSIRFETAVDTHDLMPVDAVRAAAQRASVVACGDASLAALLSDVNSGEDPLVLAGLLRMVLARGLPAPPAELAEEERAGLRQSWLAILWALANHPDGTVRVGAMRALAKESGAGLYSLREEDWQSWWNEQQRGSQNGSTQ